MTGPITMIEPEVPTPTAAEAMAAPHDDDWYGSCCVASMAPNTGVVPVLASTLLAADTLIRAQAARIAELEAERAWRPIETAPDDMLQPVVVFWINEDGEECRCFDYTEEGCWQEWANHAEHVHIIGGHGVSDTPPYTHWMPLLKAPAGGEG